MAVTTTRGSSPPAPPWRRLSHSALQAMLPRAFPQLVAPLRFANRYDVLFNPDVSRVRQTSSGAFGGRNVVTDMTLEGRHATASLLPPRERVLPLGRVMLHHYTGKPLVGGVEAE